MTLAELNPESGAKLSALLHRLSENAKRDGFINLSSRERVWYDDTGIEIRREPLE